MARVTVWFRARARDARVRRCRATEGAICFALRTNGVLVEDGCALGGMRDLSSKDNNKLVDYLALGSEMASKIVQKIVLQTVFLSAHLSPMFFSLASTST